MNALFDTGFKLGKSGNAFANSTPPYPGQSDGQSTIAPNTSDKTTSSDPGATK
jgi:hypothetical protein